MKARKERKYYIRIQDTLVDVSEDVYLAYYQTERHAHTLEEKDRRNGLVRYSSLDTEEMLGEELVADRDAVSVENAAISSILRGKLHRCLTLLSESERELINALYFEELSERQLAKRIGVHYMTIHSRKVAILRKLKKFMKI